MKQRLPVWGHRPGRSGRRLIQRTRVRSLKLWACDELLGTIVVKPLLARLETRDYRVTRSGAVFRRVLIWRTIAAADVPAFGASAKMQPPSAQSQAFDATCSAWLDRRVDTIPLRLHRLLSDLLLLALSADAQYAIRVKKCGLGARHGGRSLLSSGMRRPRRSLGSIREPWYPDINAMRQALRVRTLSGYNVGSGQTGTNGDQRSRGSQDRKLTRGPDRTHCELSLSPCRAALAQNLI